MIKIKKIIIADISNIAHYNCRGAQPRQQNIDLLFSTIPDEIELISIADCSLYHKIDDKKNYKKDYLIPKLIIESPSRTRADDFILTYAAKNNCYILSNDRFEGYSFISKDWVDNHRISFMIINNQLIFQCPEHLIFDIHPELQNEAELMESNKEIINEF